MKVAQAVWLLAGVAQVYGIGYPAEEQQHDLEELCRQMDFMPGCSLKRTCEQRGEEGGHCHRLSLLGDICANDMPRMKACMRYGAFCVPTEEGAVPDPSCGEHGPLAALPTTKAVRTAVRAVCDSHDMDDCGGCTRDSCPDPLRTYAALCKDMPDMDECIAWKTLCSPENLASWPQYCPSSSSPPAPAPSPPTPPTAPPDYPIDAQIKDLDDLCRQMPFMPGCSIMRTCRKEEHKNDPQHCNTLALIADICVTDMPRMKSCANYNASCLPENGVAPLAICKQFPPITVLPSTNTAKHAIKGVCDSHYMEACSECKQGSCPDPLLTLSRLCLEMPDMLECASWKSLCAEENLATWPEYCRVADSESTPPIMRMYFHTGIIDYVLFYDWVPRNNTQYVATLLAIFLLGIFYEGIITYRARKEFAWQQQAYLSINDDVRPLLSPTSPTMRCAKSLQSQPFRFGIDATRGFLQIFETTLSYALMLIAMSFNVGMFVAVVVGIGAGTMLFARHRQFEVRACC